MAVIPTTNIPPPLRQDYFGGVDYSTSQTQIAENRSPEMLNMIFYDKGRPEKRTGFDKLYANSLGAGAVNGIFEFKKKDGTIKFLIAHTTKLYTQTGTNQPVEIYSGLANAKARFFVMADKCYISDGTNYLVYDGTTVATVTPYIPTLTLGRAPTGGGSAFEDFNLLGAGFKDSFSGDGVAVDYTLSLSTLDATAVTATVNGVAKAETTDFTVNRTTGIVTFNLAPASGTNNVVITAYKTISGYADRIKKCTNEPLLFGGTNDTRVILSGNRDYPNYEFQSGVYDPTYFPENSYNKLGSDTAIIQGHAKQYDTYITLKDYSPQDSPIWNTNFELNSGEVSFPTKPINDEISCKAKGTIQVISNNPTWLSKKGVQQLVASSVRDERNVIMVSERVNAKLLLESNLENASSIDYDNRYWLAVNGNVYVWDYSFILPGEAVGEWVLLDNINASCFLERADGYLYFGSSTAGLVYKVKKTTDTLPYNDDGVAINAYRDSKLTAMGLEDFRKMINKIYVGLKPDVRTSCDLYFRTERNDSWTLKDTFSKYLFYYPAINYEHFSYLVSKLPQSDTAKIKSKKSVYFQTRVKNNKLNESLGIEYILTDWQTQGKVK